MLPIVHRVSTITKSVGFSILFGMTVVNAQEKPLVSGQAKIDRVFAVDLGEEGLAGTSAVVRVTIPPGIVTDDHTHTGRTSITVIVQGAVVEVRGNAKKEYKVGDVFPVSEGTTHHVENHGADPAVYIEINTSAKK